MTLANVLIKFMGNSAAENLASGIALEPEILVPVGYGDFLSDVMRSRYNYFFYHRRLQTVLADPVRLEPYMEPDIERKLEALLEKYAQARPVVDISRADSEQAMALGSVLRAHPSWYVPVLDYRISDGTFFALKNADHLRRLPNPTLTSAEFRFLRYGTPFDQLPEGTEEILYRKDLDRTCVQLIRSLSAVYHTRPGFWRETAEKLRRTPVGLAPGRREYLMDASTVPIRDEAFEELVEKGVLKKYVKQNGIINLVFGEPIASQLLTRIDRVPALDVFLATAMVREYGKAAAYHDLALMDYTYVTCIRGCLPLVLTVYRESDGLEELTRFVSDAGRYYADPVRRIMVKEPGLTVPEENREAADRMGIEIVDGNRLGEYLEP